MCNSSRSLATASTLWWSLTLGIVLVSFLSSCKKLIEVQPPINQIISSEIYNSDTTATSVLTGIYTNMSQVFTGLSSISIRAGLSADELISTAQSYDIINILYTNSLTNNGDQLFWTTLYEYIFRTNAAIEGISSSTALSTSVKKQLLGEAKFVRAFMYFYLVNFYGDVILLTTTDPKVSATASRAPRAAVYDQIISDLKDAKNDLGDNYFSNDVKTITTERLRPNKLVASALLARVYLFNGNWLMAEQEATKVISSGNYLLEDLSTTFLKESKEAIWQLQPVDAGRNTYDAEVFILKNDANNPVAGPNDGNKPTYLSSGVYNSFELGDKRKEVWIDSVSVGNMTYPYPFKYKARGENQPRTEYLIVLRLAEQYLIRSEARTEQGNIVGANSAASDLNVIRNRAGLSIVITVDKENMLKEIMQEKRIELFTEWGHRWLDLKRTGKIDQVMVAAALSKGTSWISYKALYPIPISDIQRDPNLRGHQNPGYPEQ